MDALEEQENVDKNIILSSLQRFRPLFSYVAECPDKLIKELAAQLPLRYMIFPCDIIDLRNFLYKGKISFFNPISLFSQRFAEKYLKEYSVFLVIDSHKIGKDNYRYGGLQLIFAEEVDISNILIRIIVNEPSAQGSFDAVKGIVEEFGIGVECLVSNSIPGISSPAAKLSFEIKKNFKIAQNSSELSLTPQEQKIFDFLRAVKIENNLNIQMRVAGGWVRDKLLGKESDDIDIAVDMPGYDFAQLVANAMVQHGLTDKPKAYRVSLEKTADPEQDVKDNKLMVGAIELFGQKIEFVPMRTEHYPDPESRQPAITVTNDPKEDVRRRDLTINALYYNIDTRKVDDFVGGKKDLGLGGGNIVLRTPDEPYKTFHEDPLRLLRVLRFHSRYPNSVIDPSIIQSLNDPTIQESYLKKVATERAGPEIMKMLMGENPADSLRLLFESGLYKTVFKVPSMEGIHPDGMTMDQQSPFHDYNLLEHTLQVVANLNRIMKEEGESPEMRGIVNLAALFHDFGKMKSGKPHPDEPGRMIYRDHEDVSVKMAEEIMNSLGLKQKDKEIARSIIQMHMSAVQDPEQWSKKRIGKFIRKSLPHGKEDEYKDLWKYILYHAEADSMSSRPGAYDPTARQKIFQQFQEYVASPVGQKMEPILDGHQIMGLFPTMDRKTGFINAVQEKLQEWQDMGVIDMSYGKPAAQAQAMRLITERMPEVTQHIQEYIKGRSAMANNWYKRLVKAQAVPDGIDSGCNDESEIVKGPKKAIPSYHRGMKVRDRRKGVANPQEYGKVENIKDDRIKIVWNPDNKKNRREEVFDMVEDTEILSLIVAEV